MTDLREMLPMAILLSCACGFSLGMIAGANTVLSIAKDKAKTGIRWAIHGRFYQVRDLGPIHHEYREDA